MPAPPPARPMLRIRGLHAAGPHGIARASPTCRSTSRPARSWAWPGVSGNGQTELVEVLSGMRQPTGGSVSVADVELAGADPARMMSAGVGRIPEDRHASLVGDLSVAYNLVLERLDDFRRGGRLDERRVREHATELIERFDIRARPDDPVATLSGGNIQKVLLARVLSRDPRVHGRLPADARPRRRGHRVRPVAAPRAPRRGGGHPARVRGPRRAAGARRPARRPVRGPHRGRDGSRRCGRGAARHAHGRPRAGPR